VKFPACRQIPALRFVALILIVGMAPLKAILPSTASASATLPVVTGDKVLDGAERVSLAVLSRDAWAGTHIAAPFYNSAWIRDSFAWGMIPWSGPGSGNLGDYSSTEIAHWLNSPTPDGLWITNRYSGWYDETPILIAAVADAYRLNGDRAALVNALPRLETAWASMRRQGVDPRKGSRFLLFARIGPHIAADWADQIARRGYATQIEALWYHATQAMASVERALGRRNAAAHYDVFARGIRSDINRMLWRTGTPMSRHAMLVTPFGHFTGWLGGRDYFELDSNFLCLVYGIASPSQIRSIIGFTKRHASYLLGAASSNAMPARVVYGDYDPRDYARIHDRIADGAYQNAYWPAVGMLVAAGFSIGGDRPTANMLLHQIANGFLRDRMVHEWYRAGGTPAGAAWYQWPARLYLYALYAVYLGLSDRWVDDASAATLPGTACLAPGRAMVSAHGARLAVYVERSRAGRPCKVTARLIR
jgi:hypothetical protein